MAKNLEDNYDITKRPSNGSLRAAAIIGFIVSTLPGGLGVPYSYATIADAPSDAITIALGLFGAAIGMSIFIVLNLHVGRRQKAAFIAAGGDPTGITDMMFGQMGGRQLPDGRWEWSNPNDNGDGGNSVG